MGLESKTLIERLNEIKRIYVKLEELDLNGDYRAIREWKTLAQEFVRTGVNSQGKILFEEANRFLVYRFCNLSHQESFLELQRMK